MLVRAKRTVGILAILLVLGALGGLTPRRSDGNEPAQAFLNALREKGYYDTAQDYLTQMESSPLAPIAFKQTLNYERGLTTVLQAGAEYNPREREKLLDKAEGYLNAFIQQDPNHRLVQSARNQLGNLLFLRGRIKVELAKKDNNPALLAEARKFFDDSFQLFTQAKEELKAKLAPINNRRYDASQREQEELRDQLRSDYLQAQLLAAQVKEESSDAVEKGSPEFNKILEEAEALYKDIESKYRSWAAGLYAKMALGRCLQRRGKLNEALGYYTELLDESNSPAFNTLKTDTLQLAMDCWLDPSVKLYAEAVNRGMAWQQSLRPHELRTPQALEILYKLAVAHKLYAENLKEKNPKDRQVGDLMRMARNLAVEVSKHDSEFQNAARQLIGEIRGVEIEAPERPQPKSFAEAQAAAKDALDKMQNAAFLAEALPARIEAETDAQVKQELQTQLDEAKASLGTLRSEAVDYYRLALELADKETPLEDLCLARMTLAHLLYLQQEYYDAAVLAEFVARKYPAQFAARDAAKIALAAYVQLYSSAPEQDRAFETQQLQSLCNYIVGQWPDQPVAADAWNALIPFIIRNGEFERARKGVESIPADAPQRGEVELKIGNALWAAYRSGMVELRKWEKEGVPPGTDLAQRQSQLDEWKSQAEQILSAGLDRVRANTSRIDGSLVRAGIALAQIYIETQRSPRAVELLEDPKIGPLTLARANDPATQAPGLAEEIYRTSLRAYLGNLVAGADATEAVAKAKGIMAELKQSMAGDPQGQQRLVATYVALARDLKSQMEIASVDERKALSQGFEVFLSQVSKESNDFQVLNWAGETFYSLAESFDDPKSAVAPVTANGLYRQALAVYQKMIDLASKQSTFLPNPQYAPILELRTAMISRRIGDYKGAIDIFLKLLTEKNMMLNVQIEAARTFQQWGAMPGQQDMYQRAMLGYFPDKNAKTPTNIIWGWGKIGKLTSGRKEFEAAFFESRLNLAECRFAYGKQLKDEASRNRYLDLAKQDIWFTYRLAPELGGPEWKPKFEKLLREIQQARGETANGLAEFASKTSASAGTP